MIGDLDVSQFLVILFLATAFWCFDLYVLAVLDASTRFGARLNQRSIRAARPPYTQ